MIIRASGPRFFAIIFSHKKAQNAQKRNDALAETILAPSLSNCFCALCAFLWRLMKCLPSREARRTSQIFFDAQKLVVLRDAIRTRKRSGFDLCRVRCNREIGDERILSLTGTMRDDRGVLVSLRELDAVECFGEGPDLVDLDQN